MKMSKYSMNNIAFWLVLKLKRYFLDYHDNLWFACCRNKVSIDQGSKTLKQPIDEESKVVEVPFMRPDTVCLFK